MPSGVNHLLFPLFALGIVVTGLVLLAVLTPLAEKLGLLDFPDDRKRHGEPVPMVGGISDLGCNGYGDRLRCLVGRLGIYPAQ